MSTTCLTRYTHTLLAWLGREPAQARLACLQLARFTQGDGLVSSWLQDYTVAVNQPHMTRQQPHQQVLRTRLHHYFIIIYSALVP
jgi:hypothetical protein